MHTHGGFYAHPGHTKPGAAADEKAAERSDNLERYINERIRPEKKPAGGR